jgi:hypothetical protein
MEDQVVRIRRRVPRKKTFGERVERLILAPHLPRGKRTQRVAIIAMVVLMGVYLLVSPMLGDIFGGGRKDTAPPSTGTSTSPPPHALGKKK